jgi:hypothetical protein
MHFVVWRTLKPNFPTSPPPLAEPGRGSSLEHPGQGDVFFQRQQRQKVKGLEYHPHPIPAESGQLGLRQLRQVPAVQDYPAAADGLQAADDVQEGAFAATALAGDGDEFP